MRSPFLPGVDMRAPRSAPVLVALVPLAVLPLAALPIASAEEIPLEVQLHEVGARFHILPPDINAEVGDTLRLNVMNQGNASHDLLVCGEAPKPQVTCDHVLAHTGPLAPLEAKVILVQLEEPGEFEYYGTGFGEKSADMRGRLHVTGEAAKKGLPLSPVVGLGALAVGAALLALGRRSS